MFALFSEHEPRTRKRKVLLFCLSFPIRFLKADEEKAERIIFGYRDKEFSCCGAASFALIERLRIREAMAFDGHFEQYGKFALLRA